MIRTRRFAAVGLALAVWMPAAWYFGLHAFTAYAQQTATATVTEAPAQADTPPLPENYQALCEAFMANQWDKVPDLLKQTRREMRELTREQRNLLVDIRREALKFPPKWWDRTRSSTNVSFKAGMWGKGFVANYMPSEMMGVQAAVGIDARTQRLKVIVSWRPAYVDNPEPLEGYLAQAHGLTQADLAEVIIWHELGHNYITLHLPLRDAIKLYTEHHLLFSHVQEFYADMTALRHASPRSARLTLMFRLRQLHRYQDREPHTRAAYAIGALLLSEFLENPGKWPMVHFPPEVPADNLELETIKYVYEHFDPKWTPEEYFQLHQFIDTWIRTGRNGDRVLRERGRVRLPNDLDLKLMVNDDREHIAEREKWIRQKLEAIIASGRADKKAEADNPQQGGGGWRGIVLPD